MVIVDDCIGSCYKSSTFFPFNQILRDGIIGLGGLSRGWWLPGDGKNPDIFSFNVSAFIF
jgi:hypothetical protein